MKPPSLDTSPKLRILILCLLYLAQGLPNGFITGTLATWLTERDCSLSEIANLTAIAVLPWTFKFIWGPIIDRFSFPSLRLGRRRPWILAAQFMMLTTLFAIILIPDLVANIQILLGLVFLHNVFASLQDVSADALAVDILKENERGKANGFMRGAAYAGSFTGYTIMGVITARFSLQLAVILQVLIMIGVMMAPLLLREHKHDRLFPWSGKGEEQDNTEAEGGPSRETITSIRDLFRDLLKAFSLRSTILGGVLALLILGAQNMLATASKILYVKQLGWTLEEIAKYGGIGTIVGLGGSLVAGFLADRFSGKKVALISTYLLGMTWILFGLGQGHFTLFGGEIHLLPEGINLWENRAFIAGFIFLEQMFIAIMTVALYAVFMSISWPVIAGTHFTTYMALLCLSLSLGAKLASYLGEHPNFTLVYAIAGISQFLFISILYFIDPHETRNKLGES